MEPEAHTIAAGALEMGIALTGTQVSSLATHLEMVFEANETMNLTSIARADAVPLHVLDSLFALAPLAAAPAGPFADLGTGAGYPGIPLAVVSGRPAALVESVRKKAAFLERAVAGLRLEATVHPIRAEDLAREMPDAFAAVTARALSSLPSLVELAAPMLKLGGVLICLKGRLEDDEVRRGDRACELCGMGRESTEPVSVPGVEGQRAIVVYRRLSAAQVRLPRRPGMAQRQPLA